MYNKRIIPVLLLKGRGAVKTKKFANPVYLGDAVNTVWLFTQKLADEIIILDIDASKTNQVPDLHLISDLASQCFMPMAYGGGVKTLQQARDVLGAGVEKIVLNSSVIDDYRLISEIAGEFGNQSVVVALDVVSGPKGLSIRRPSDGRIVDKTAVEHMILATAAGAGELLIQDVERDGTKSGYNLELFTQLAAAVEIPVIALGGAGTESDLERVIETTGVSAAAAGSIFVFAGRRNAVLISMPEAIEKKSNDVQFSTTPDSTIESEDRPNSKRRICSLTVLDDSDPDFEVDHEGVCLLARRSLEKLQRVRLEGTDGMQRLDQIADRARREGKRREYDCLIGLSGGVDSSYVAMMVKDMGLRPLALHVDNGWNSNTAVLNIKRIVDILDIDLHTHVIDWNEMRDLQRAMFRASVPDVELLTDHAIVSSMFKLATQFRIKTVIFGVNVTTESTMPEAWAYSKRDAAHILSVHKKYGEREIKTFPLIFPLDFLKYKYLHGIHYESLLSFINFNKNKALDELRIKLGYVPYPRKHGESRFTQFYQEYYLPTKFGYDKRKGHLSSLILAGQLTREEALRELQKPLYADSRRMEQDIEYVRLKLGFSETEWNEIMAAPPVSHDKFPGYYCMLKRARKIRKLLPF